MIEAYMNATLDVLRLAGQMFLQRIDYELRRFGEDLLDFINDLDRHPRRDWRERFDAFLADQTARGREITPESRRELIIYLEMWDRNVYGGPPREKPKNSSKPGGIWNPLNWPRAIYTGDANSPDADYVAAMRGMGGYYLENAGSTHQQLQIINNLDPTYLSSAVDGILTAAEGEELSAIVMENQSDALGAIQTATEALGQLRDLKNAAKALKDTRGFTRFADEAHHPRRARSLKSSTKSSKRRSTAKSHPSVRFKKWRRGEAIDKPMPDGSPPSWKTVQSRYWKNRYELSKASDEFTPRQLAEMRKGNAPRDFNPRTKQWERRELHHVDPQRHSPDNSPANIRELRPDWHGEVDPFRQVPGVEPIRGIR